MQRRTFRNNLQAFGFQLLFESHNEALFRFLSVVQTTKVNQHRIEWAYEIYAIFVPMSVVQKSIILERPAMKPYLRGSNLRTTSTRFSCNKQYFIKINLLLFNWIQCLRLMRIEWYRFCRLHNLFTNSPESKNCVFDWSIDLIARSLFMCNKTIWFRAMRF